MRKTVLLLAAAIACTAALQGCGKSKKVLEAERAASAAQAQRKQVEDVIARLQGAVSQQLKDPSSAQFQDVHLNAAQTAICGRVNAKNSFGGYVGFRPFVSNADGVKIAPEACGKQSLVAMSESPQDGLACLGYIGALQQSFASNCADPAAPGK